jgi:hypothetical protein
VRNWVIRGMVGTVLAGAASAAVWVWLGRSDVTTLACHGKIERRQDGVDFEREGAFTIRVDLAKRTVKVGSFQPVPMVSNAGDEIAFETPPGDDGAGNPELIAHGGVSSGTIDRVTGYALIGLFEGGGIAVGGGMADFRGTCKAAERLF